MSYDVYIADQSFNMTWNVGQLFRDHIFPEGDKTGLNVLDGMTGKQAAAVLTEAFRRINETRHRLYQDGVVGEPAFCAKYDAENGWGSAVGAIVFLGQILGACALHPRAKVRVW